MDTATIIGFIAAALTTIAFIPQVIRTWKTRDARNLSLPTFIIFSAGIFLWLVYGILIGDGPIIMANTVTFVLGMTLLFLKLRYGKVENDTGKGTAVSESGPTGNEKQEIGQS